MSMKDILNIKLEYADQLAKELGISFIIRDGKLKGFIKEPK